MGTAASMDPLLLGEQIQAVLMKAKAEGKTDDEINKILKDLYQHPEHVQVAIDDASKDVPVIAIDDASKEAPVIAIDDASKEAPVIAIDDESKEAPVVPIEGDVSVPVEEVKA